VAADGPVFAAVCSVLAALRAGGPASCEALALEGLADGTAAGRVLAVACTEATCGTVIWDWTVGTHGTAGVAVGLGRLGALPGDPVGSAGDGAGLLGDRAGLVGDGVALPVADGVGDGVTLPVPDGVGDGVADAVADGADDGVAVGVPEGVGGVPEGAGDGSALGAAPGMPDGDGAVAGAEGEVLGPDDALAGAAAAAPAMMTPRTARTAVRAPTNIGPPAPGHRTYSGSNDKITIYYSNSASGITCAATAWRCLGAARHPGLAFLTDAERV
jgi:hypothetical protein